MDVIPRQNLDIQGRTLGSFQTFDKGCLGSWNQDTALQNQAVPVQGGVPGRQDQQRRSFDDPRIPAEDQINGLYQRQESK